MEKKAFTLTELIIVMVIIAIMASWGLPQFGNALSRAKAKNAINSLATIHAANLVYQVRHNDHTCPQDNNCSNITEINAINGTNSLNIISGGVNYYCTDGGGICYGEIASTFQVSVDLVNPIAPTNPQCKNWNGAAWVAAGGNKVCP